jgi:hypothetical protein
MARGPVTRTQLAYWVSLLALACWAGFILVNLGVAGWLAMAGRHTPAVVTAVIDQHRRIDVQVRLPAPVDRDVILRGHAGVPQVGDVVDVVYDPGWPWLAKDSRVLASNSLPMVGCAGAPLPLVFALRRHMRKVERDWRTW